MQDVSQRVSPVKEDSVIAALLGLAAPIGWTAIMLLEAVRWQKNVIKKATAT